MTVPPLAGGQWRFALACVLCLFGVAQARDIAVGPSGEYQTIEAAVFGSAPGDRLLIAPGTYQARDVTVPHDLTVEGQGGVTITSDKPVAKGLFVPQAGFTIRNVTLAGARSPDLNGAGVRFEGGDLLVEDVTFRANEDGILATGAPDGSVTVRRALFEDNGHGDGYSHAIYQANGARLLVEDSRFVGTRGGHHVKSLAPLVLVTSNSFDDGDGRTSYVVDATGGGRLVVTRNEVVRRASADQDHLFNYDTSRGGALGSVTVEDNVVTTHKRRTKALRNPEGAPASLARNAWATAGRGSYAGALEIAGDAVRTAPPEQRQSGVRDLGPPPAAAPLSEADIARLTPEQQRGVRRAAAALDRSPQRTARAVRRPTGLLTPPRIETPEGAYAGFRLVPQDGDTGWLTFGVPFGSGAVRADALMVLTVDGEGLPTQVDVLATHPDGSVRHAAVTAYLAPGRGERDAALMPGRAPAYGNRDDISYERRVGPAVSVSGQGPGGAFVETVTLGTDEDAGVWLDGPLVTERTEAYEVTPLLRLRADRRSYADGTVRTRLTFENHEAYRPGGRDMTYAVTVSEGEPVWRSPQVRHYRHSGWTTVLPGARSAWHVQHDPAALMASGAFLPFDLSVPVRADALGDAPGGPVLPGDHAMLAPYMPMTGGRPEVGPVTGWTAAWLKSQHPAAYAVMIRAADAGLTVPWHFEEDGAVVTPARRPGFWADPRGADGGPDGFPESAWSEEPGGWTVDTAHKPDLAFPAYLVTAEPTYARALAHEAAYAVTGIWPELRGRRGDMLLHLYQTRETAWSLRTIGNAAWALPDDHPLKAEFGRVLTRNLRAVPDHAIGAGPAKGVLPRYGDATTVAPWQQDFVVMTLAQEALRGTPGARAALMDIAPYLSGRVLEAGGGVRFAAAADHVVSPGGAPARSWAQIVGASPPGEPYLGAADGYHSVLLAALSAAYAATGEPQLALAAERLVREPGAEGLADPSSRTGLAASPQMGLALPPGVRRP